MAVLSDTDRKDVMTKYVQAYFVALGRTADLDTGEVQSLINDLDTWLDLNQGAANLAVSAGVRAKASTSTKFAALAYVALKRGGLL